MEEKNSVAIIMCAGEGERWGNYLGVPKHLIKIDGETLVERTTRLIKKYSPETKIYIVANSDDYSVEGAEIYKPNLATEDWKKDTDKFLSSEPIWNKNGRTRIFYGDVWFSDEAMEKIFSPLSYSKDWIMFGRDTGSEFTGKSWGELFCLKFLPKNIDKIKKDLNNLAMRQETGELKRTGGWELYRSLINKPIGIQQGEENWVNINDFTDDFDFPIDYDEWIKRYGSKNEEKPLSILIATPTMGDVSIQFAHSLVALILATKERFPDCKIAMATTIRKMHHRARTELAEAFLRTDCTHILWIDDDNIPRKDDLIKLIEDDLPLVSGLYFRRAEPFEPIIMVQRENGRGTERRPDLYRNKIKKPIKIHSTGMGFMLIKREVIAAVRAMGAPLFDIRGGIGEDIWFCTQVQGAGYNIWLDPRVEVGHLGDKIMITGKTYDEFYNRKIVELVKKAEEIDGWMSYKELLYLAEVASNSNFTIEVGSYAGRSATVLSNSRRLICVDYFKGSKEHNITGDELFEKFKENMSDYTNVQWLRGNSADLADNFPDESADVIFIDASHEYKDVKKDIKAYWSKLGVGGKMIFHDYIPEWDGVRRAIDEFVEEIGAFGNFSKIPNTSMVEIIKL